MNKLLDNLHQKRYLKISALFCFIVAIIGFIVVNKYLSVYKLISISVSSESSKYLKRIHSQYLYSEYKVREDIGANRIVENGEYIIRVKGKEIYRKKKLDDLYEDFIERPFYLGISSDESSYLYSLYKEAKRILRLVHDDGNIEEFELYNDSTGEARFVNHTKKIAFIITNPLTGQKYISYHGKKISCELDEIYNDFIFSQDGSQVLYLGFNVLDSSQCSKRIYYIGINEKLFAIKAKLIYGESDIASSDPILRRVFRLGFSPDEKHFFCIYEKYYAKFSSLFTERIFEHNYKKSEYSVVIDGKIEKKYHGVSTPVFSPDEKHYGYWGIKSKNKVVLILNGQEVRTEDLTDIFPLFKKYDIYPSGVKMNYGFMNRPVNLIFVDNDHIGYYLNMDDEKLKKEVVFKIEGGRK